MKVEIIAASNRQPDWIEAAFRHYAGRLRGGCTLNLTTVQLAPRTRSAPPQRAVAIEGQRMLARLPQRAHVVALTEDGSPWNTLALADRLQSWAALGAPICLLIGGPDGLAPACITRAVERWSLSPLTLPHGLVRVIVAEALYRAWSLSCGHPYHRA